MVCFAGSLLALLCYLGFGLLILLLSVIGAGFPVNDAVLASLRLQDTKRKSLGVAKGGLCGRGYRRNDNIPIE